MDTQAENDRPTGETACDKCGDVKRVCCGEFKTNQPDGTGPLEYSEALCVDCCGPHGAGRDLSDVSYEALECDC